jgi:hypothetical protein
MTKKIISIAKDFSPVPAGRFMSRAINSGERFRNEFLIPLMLDPTIDKLEIDLDGLSTTPPSFFEEAFGGLVRIARDNAIDPADIKKKIVILKCNDYKDLEIEVEGYINNALEQL